MISVKNGLQAEASKLSRTRKLSLSGLIIALYLVIMWATASFSFGQYQIRIATSLYALAGAFPFAVLPLGLANMLSNLAFGGLGLPDAAGGFCAGIITSRLIFLAKRRNLPDFVIALPIIFVLGLVVPIWLSILINVPYPALAVSVTVGQIIPGIAGVFLYKAIAKILPGIIRAR